MKEGQTCQFCRVGRYQATKAPYIRIIQHQAVTIPNAPALQCDICRAVLFERHFIQQINFLMENEPQATPRPQISQPYFEERPFHSQKRKLRD